MSVAQIVISTAPHESQTLAFNYASLALNNSFFLHYLVSLGPCTPSPFNIKHYYNCACLGEVETANKGIAEPRSGVVGQMGEPRTNADSRWRDRLADGLPARSQDVRDGRGDRHALIERIRLACHRRPRPSRRHRDLWRRHTPHQRPTTNALAGWQH